ncbi:MAG: flagellar hook-associated protein 3, partial [Lentisphaerae bacterium]
AKNRFDEQKIHLTEVVSNIEDIDVAEAAVEMSQLQASYQATIQLAARINSLSLMNEL